MSGRAILWLDGCLPPGWGCLCCLLHGWLLGGRLSGEEYRRERHLPVEQQNTTCRLRHVKYSLSTFTIRSSLRDVWADRPCNRYKVCPKADIAHAGIHQKQREEWAKDRSGWRALANRQPSAPRRVSHLLGRRSSEEERSHSK